jgi:hypothetical protein
MRNQETGTKKSGFIGKLLCKHDWVKRENWYQPDRSTGLVAYKCAECGKVVKRSKSQI